MLGQQVFCRGENNWILCHVVTTTTFKWCFLNIVCEYQPPPTAYSQMLLYYSHKCIHAQLKLKEITTKLRSGKFIFYLSDQKVFMVRIDNLSGDNWCGKFVLFNISNREMEEGKKENNEIKNNNIFQYSFDAMRFKQSVSGNKKR